MSRDLSPTWLYTLSLHDALPIFADVDVRVVNKREGKIGENIAAEVYVRAAPVRVQRRLYVAALAQLGEHLPQRSEEHTSELQSRFDLVCRLLLEKKKKRLQHTYD